MPNKVLDEITHPLSSFDGGTVIRKSPPPPRKIGVGSTNIVLKTATVIMM